MFKYGFELEGTFHDGLLLSLPPKGYPTDGFPGLVELRSTGGKSLPDAYAEILTQYIKYPADFHHHEVTFLANQRAELRRRYHIKENWDIQNIYGKHPRALGNKTIASLQVNISNQISGEFTDKDKVFHPARYGLFDVPRVVKALDEAFKSEISKSRRQPGEYAIKGNRLEYRSLPNFVFPLSPSEAKGFLDKIEKAVEG